jgi:hypothetical protein
VPRQATIGELEDWELNGAVWRPVEIRGGRAVVDLCSCTGELMERVESEDPAFMDLVRARRDEEPPQSD